MSIQANTNVSPYFDDFDSQKNFYRLMFKAGYPIQARELTQLQTILGDQIEKVASTMFKTGDVIIPGEYSLNTNASYVRVASITQGIKAKDFIGYTLTGVTSGVKASVNFAEEETDDDDATFYVEYTSSGNTSEFSEFLEGETLESDHPNFYTATVGVNGVSKPVTSKPLGSGSLFVCKEGFYYIDGLVVRSDEQTITLDKYDTRPTYKIGFVVDEDFVTSNEDPSLLDNSRGSSNFAAPGADRLKITLTLAKRSAEIKDPHFVHLVDVFFGNVTGNPNRSGRLDFIYDILAKRTFDESGDYIISDFPIKPLEYWNSAIVNGEEVSADGLFDVDTEGMYDPVPGTGETQSLTFEEADENYSISISPGHAYVQGYDVGFENPMYVFGKKSRNENIVLKTSTQINPGLNITVNNVHNLIDIENINKDVNTEAFASITTYRNFIDGFTSESLSNNNKITQVNAGNRPWTTWHIILDRDFGDLNENKKIRVWDGNSVVAKSLGTVVYPTTTSPTNTIRNSIVLNLDKEYESINRGDIIVPQGEGTSSDSARVMVAIKVDPVKTGVIIPRYIQPKNLLSSDDDFYNPGSTFSLGISSSEFFTEIGVETLSPGKEWKINDIVRGRTSNATGKIEEGSTENLLILSNILGEFLNNEILEQDTDTGLKIGRIYRPGEVEKFIFNDYLGESQSRPINSGGGDSNNNGSGDVLSNAKTLYTPDVFLIYENTLRRLRDGFEESGLQTQSEANEWFYKSIKELQGGETSSDIKLSITPPAIANPGDVWVHSETYDMFIWEGTTWVALTETSQDLGILGTTVNGSSVDVDGVSTTTTDEVSPVIVRDYSHFDLGGVNYITLSSLGTGVTLSKGTGFVYDSDKNDIVLTPAGRKQIYEFPYVAIDPSINTPKVNFEVVAYYGVPGAPGTETIRGYAVVLGSKISNTINKTKSLFAELPDNIDNFTSDIALQSISENEILSLANGSLFSGFSNSNYIFCDNFSGDASNELTAGDLVTFTNDGGQVEHKIVLFATQPYGFGTSRSKSIIYFTTTLLEDVTGKVAQRIRVADVGDPKETLLYNLPVRTVSSLESDPNITGINYQIYREFVSSLEAGKNTITISTSKENEKIISLVEKTMITCAEVINGNTDDNEEHLGRILKLSESDSISFDDSGREVTYKLAPDDGFDVDMNVKLIVPIQVTNAKAKRKTLIRNQQVVVTFDESNPSDIDKSPASQSVISIGESDIYSINSIEMQVDGSNVDVTKNYELDNGQRDNMYFLGSITRIPGKPAATGDIIINYNYFEHDSDGDFFSVDSYTHDDGVVYKDIPTYVSRSNIDRNSTRDKDAKPFIKLSDCADFRSVCNTLPVTDKGVRPSYISLLEPTKPTEKSTNFLSSKNGGNASVCRIPIPGSQFEADIQHYLPKIDTLFLDRKGSLFVSSGLPSENPVAPSDIPTGIRLYDIFVPAYTFSVKDLVIKKHNYRRYTMKDISKIDNKLTKVQNLVALSLLEQESVSLSVRDSVTGLERFKNGIVVDAFRDHSKGNVGLGQYRNSIDPKTTHLRPPFVRDQIHLEDVNQTDEQRSLLGNYQNNSNIVTCNYTTVDFISQPSATRFINCQPYSVFTYSGNLILTPSVDTFQDVTVLPDLIIENNSVWDAMQNMNEILTAAGMGTVWGDWETTSVDRRVEGRNTIIDTDQSRDGITLNTNPETASVNETSYGERVVDVQLASTMRTIPVFITASKLKPNTRYYAFFDNINVSDWVSPDSIVDGSNFSDGISRYQGSVNSNPGGFGKSILSDDIGNVSGVFLIPNGRSPVKDSTFNGNLIDVSYNTSGPTRSFATGQRTLVLTSSVSNSGDLSQVEAIAKKEFTSSGVIIDKQDTIVATRIPETVPVSEERTLTTIIPPPPRPRPRDPIAQTFNVDSSKSDGVFVNEVDIFFRTKDEIEGVEVYLVTVESQYPSKKILPHSRVVKNSNSIIRVMCDLGSLSSTQFTQGMTVVGQKSGATAIVKDTIVFNSDTLNSSNNVNTRVYNIVLSNYIGEFTPGEQIVPDISPPIDAIFTIPTNEVIPTRVDVKSLGKDHDLTTNIEFSAPELPGGRRATASLKIAENLNGEIYEVVITDPGSGYVKIPSVQITGSGSDAEFAVRVRDGVKSVDMGVATSDDATMPTTFKFGAPVYLLGDTSYAVVVKSPTSINYTAWISKLGENQIGTSRRVVSQSSMGSLFLSQDGGLWTEDQTMDLMFNLRRCEFIENTVCEVFLRNSPIPKTLCPVDCIQTDPGRPGNQNWIKTSTVFGINPKVVKVTKYNHGFVPGDLVALEGVEGDPGGIPDEGFNTLHEVIHADIDDFTIMVDHTLTGNNTRPKSISSGGSKVMCTSNRAYETINLYSGLITFPDTEVIARSRSTQHAGISLYNQSNQYVSDELSQIPIMETFYYSGAKQVASALNEAKYNDSFKLNGRTSLETRFRMMTSDSSISPVIDLERTNMNIVRNLVDNPTQNSIGATTAVVTFQEDISSLIQVGSTTSFTGKSGISREMIVTDIMNDYNRVTFAGGSELNELDIDSQLDVGVAADTVTVQRQLDFKDETHRYGSTYAKWISKSFLFENPCDGIEIRLRCVLYGKNDVRVYYSPKSLGNSSSLVEDTTWIPFNINKEIPGLPNNIDTIKGRDPDNVDPRLINSLEWQTLVWSAQDLASFDGMSIKIVMTQDNPALVPLIDDMQLIVSE